LDKVFMTSIILRIWGCVIGVLDIQKIKNWILSDWSKNSLL